MTIEKDFDVRFIAALALREKQIQQNYRPIIAIHKWFARRPGTLFRGLLLSEFGSAPVRDLFYQGNCFPGLRVADPFMGGGTPLIEANRVGCDVLGWDINPMAWWIVREEIEHLDLPAYRRAATELTASLEHAVGDLYRTRCTACGSTAAHVKYFLWVKTLRCRKCTHEMDLFPGYLVAEDRRHPKNVLLCSNCGALAEVDDRHKPGKCLDCGSALLLAGPAGRSSCLCPKCGTANSYPDPSAGPPKHRMFAIEYHCRECRSRHRGRFFKKPDDADLAKAGEAASRWQGCRAGFVPDDAIPDGDETDRLHRWGYQHYREMFNDRQLLGLELSCKLIGAVRDQRVRNALATNLSDLLRYQNMLCRYDTMALKSLDIFSVHGFPVGLVACESNLLGIQKGDGNVGSGGWSNIIDKFARAKAYCDQPFEVVQRGSQKLQLAIPGEWIGDRRNGKPTDQDRAVELHAATATTVDLPAGSLDAVLTDPPYFGNVQYAELMDFCYIWLRRLAATEEPAFKLPSTRNSEELTGNVTMARDLSHFTEGLSQVLRRMAYALKPGGPLAFTYHHNRLDAYYPVAVASLDSGLTCSASLPCPAEMGASIHISGTGSSVVDTVFVCRSTGKIQRSVLADSAAGIAALVKRDIQALLSADLKPTRGDIRCVINGHLIRLAIWRLRDQWEAALPVATKLELVTKELAAFGGPSKVEEALGADYSKAPFAHDALVFEDAAPYGVEDDEVSF